MNQNFKTGRLGDKTGRFIGKKVADYLGIKLIAGSNEGTYMNENVVIKSARYNNSSFGITKSMLKRISKVILVKESNQRGIFELYLVSLTDIESSGTDTRSKGSSRNKVVKFSVSKAIEMGNKFDELKIEFPF